MSYLARLAPERRWSQRNRDNWLEHSDSRVSAPQFHNHRAASTAESKGWTAGPVSGLDRGIREAHGGLPWIDAETNMPPFLECSDEGLHPGQWPIFSREPG